MDKVFIAGARIIRKLDKEIEGKLSSIMKNNISILVGDANGVDKLVQSFLAKNNYENVTVYTSGELVRNNVGKWEQNKVEVNSNIKGFDFYIKKDVEMAKVTDYGFMVWDGKSKGTLNNIINLVSMNKKVLVYLTDRKKYFLMNSFKKLEELLDILEYEETNMLYQKLRGKETNILHIVE